MTVLLLAGTREAQQIARDLVGRQTAVVVSLAGATRAPLPQGVPTLSGGFGGDQGFRTYLRSQDVSVVLDATHPFASRVSARTARVCREEGVPYCLLLRPEWVPGPGDNWTDLEREEDAARHIAPGETVFLATGRQTLERFANLDKCHLICRQIEPPTGPFPFAKGEFLMGQPPFSAAEEVALFRELGVDWLVVKNAGGEAPRSKLVAARELGIRVGMIRRPSPPDAPCVATVEAALDWLDGL